MTPRIYYRPTDNRFVKVARCVEPNIAVRDQCRRAAVYLRWNEGDADELVSSIYAGRTVRRGKTEPETEAAEPATEAPSLPDK